MAIFGTEKGKLGELPMSRFKGSANTYTRSTLQWKSWNKAYILDILLNIRKPKEYSDI